MKIKNIAIVGGTHGNEYTGVYLIRELNKAQFQKKWEGLNIELLIGNPKAYEKCVRFIDHDLNRSFTKKNLADFSLSGYEANRAKAICQKLGGKDDPKMDFIIDMHTTTSNMGVSIIISDNNDYNFKLAAYIKTKIPECNIYYMPAASYADDNEHSFLISMAAFGFAIEVGPIANGIIRHDINKKTKKVIHATLDFINQTNAGINPVINDTVEVFKHRKTVAFPKNKDSDISAIIHENLQDNDYKPLKKGDSIFSTMEGECIAYDEDEELYPVFINEAAYYYKNIAFSLTEKITVNTKNGLTEK
ncbi:aspartoacylase [Candidatus Venteria ishoeyi]|uniref:Aspartoacylase n=1 Tax=Candidatus Venteria ishoeyi TaxID=1899563 RepID=A0A1H6FFJ5_9GAMM|nr:aspartoacylase [Candidatus Venteria ishoeyi]SEH08848.1 aspartoacylase [Candidatus Venteria ishoeyi]